MNFKITCTLFFTGFYLNSLLAFAGGGGGSSNPYPDTLLETVRCTSADKSIQLMLVAKQQNLPDHKGHWRTITMATRARTGLLESSNVQISFVFVEPPEKLSTLDKGFEIGLSGLAIYEPTGGHFNITTDGFAGNIRLEYGKEAQKAGAAPVVETNLQCEILFRICKAAFENS